VDPIALLFVSAVGFAAGYGVREWMSRKRRRHYRQGGVAMIRLAHWLRQLGNIGRTPPRLIFGE
jgi:hypothetical protein